MLLLDRDSRRAGPEQGVIEEARRRQRQRQRRARVGASAVGALMLAVAGGILAANLGGRSHAARPGHAHPRPGVASGRNTGARAGAARLVPALEGGQYGWNVMFGEGGTCCTTPAQGDLLIGGITVEPRADYETLTFLASPELAAVIVNGRERFPVTALPGRLPFHLRLVEVKIPTKPGAATRAPGSVPASSSPAQALIPLDARGHEVRSSVNPEPRLNALWWERPARLPHGPCQLRSRELSGLTPQWGHVASAIVPYPGSIIGRAFFSCIDIEYYLHGWPLDAAILLDAAHPGTPPAAIPGLRPVPGLPRYLDGPGESHGDITATRRGAAWLVVAGGSGSAQRVEVLRHLAASVGL